MKKSNEIEKVIRDIQDAQKLPPRIFTYAQLLRISDDNHGVLNRCIDMTIFNTDDDFILIPVMFHHHGYEKPIKKHLRTNVSLNGSVVLGIQDITFEQWEQGAELNQTTTSLKPIRLAS